MSMKILVLTTETSHHVYFAKKLAETFGNVIVYCEKFSSNKFLFDTHHAFEDRRDIFEITKWFEGKSLRMADILITKEFNSLNDPDAIKSLSNEKPDIVLVFGTGLLRREILNLFRHKIFNLHGGDPERYRGLDNHLWGIYHGDFSSLVTTIHHMNDRLDDGDIVAQAGITIDLGTTLESLRSINTELCVKMSTTLIDSICRFGKASGRKQLASGRYYSAMPTVLKEVCIKRFSQYTKGYSSELHGKNPKSTI